MRPDTRGATGGESIRDALSDLIHVRSDRVHIIGLDQWVAGIDEDVGGIRRHDLAQHQTSRRQRRKRPETSWQGRCHLTVQRFPPETR